MNNLDGQRYGGAWTQEKLEVLGRYLRAYTNALKNQKQFKRIYIDAFAGTGEVILPSTDSEHQDMFSELLDEETLDFLEGSARIALGTDPQFDKYVFIEKSPKRADKLKCLREEFPELSEKIVIKNRDANTYLQDVCGSWPRDYRAVLFLDPFGMQVEWETIECIAATKAVDFWYLFPIGAVSRLLVTDGVISDAWRKRLDVLFGEESWFDYFYESQNIPNLFEVRNEIKRTADFEAIKDYFLRRLNEVFIKVAPNALLLRNSKNSPIFLLCFAASNKNGAKIAVKIANHILGMK